MTITKVDQQIELVVEEPAIGPSERVVVVVGFDGSASAYRARDATARLISGRVGTIAVVYVAHIPAGAEMSAAALSESLKAFDAADLAFAEAVRERLEGVKLRWRYQRRDGLIGS